MASSSSSPSSSSSSSLSNAQFLKSQYVKSVIQLRHLEQRRCQNLNWNLTNPQGGHYFLGKRLKSHFLFTLKSLQDAGTGSKLSSKSLVVPVSEDETRMKLLFNAFNKDLNGQLTLSEFTDMLQFADNTFTEKQCLAMYDLVRGGESLLTLNLFVKAKNVFPTDINLKDIIKLFASRVLLSKEITEKIVQRVSDQDEANLSLLTQTLAEYKSDIRTIEESFTATLDALLRDSYDKKTSISNAAKIAISSTATHENKLVSEHSNVSMANCTEFAIRTFQAMEICEMTSQNAKSLQDIWQEENNGDDINSSDSV